MDWLHCEAIAGQFPTEAAIRGKDYSGEEFSLFVPVRHVRSSKSLGDEWVLGEVRVEVLDSRDDFFLIELPGQTLSNGRTITVRKSQLTEDHCAQQPCGQ